MMDNVMPEGSEVQRQVEYWEIDALKEYRANPRTHPPDQIARIARSITEFGWTVPLLVSESGEIVAGHGRLLAARHLGLEKVPVIQLEGLSEAQVRAYRIADNKLTLMGDWDENLLTSELHALNAEEFDLEMTGFSESEIEKLLSSLDDNETAPEDFPEYDDDIKTDFQCPKCGYEWSGKQK